MVVAEGLADEVADGLADELVGLAAALELVGLAAALVDTGAASVVSGAASVVSAAVSVVSAAASVVSAAASVVEAATSASASGAAASSAPVAGTSEGAVHMSASKKSISPDMGPASKEGSVTFTFWSMTAPKYEMMPAVFCVRYIEHASALACCKAQRCTSSSVCAKGGGKVWRGRDNIQEP